MKGKALILIALCALALSACTSKATVKQDAATPQAQQAKAKAQKLVQECAFSGRKKAVEACLQKHGITQQCGEKAVQGANFLTHSGRQAFLVKLEGCAR